MTESARATMGENPKTITLENRWIRRRFDIEQGFATAGYAIRPGGEGAWLPMYSFTRNAPAEAEIVLDGALLRVGLWKHPHFGHECQFAYLRHEIAETENGVRFDVTLRPRAGAPDIELVLHHLFYSEASSLKKWVTLRNTGAKPVTLDRMVVEVVAATRLGREVQLLDAYVSPKAAMSPDFISWHMHEFDRPLGIVIAPGEEFESFATYTVVSKGYTDDRAAAWNALLRAEAPWTQNPPLRQLFGRPVHWTEILELGKRAKDLGFEAIDSFWEVHFTCTGDFELRPEVFPNGEADLRRLVDGLHAIGMKLILYCGFCIAVPQSKTRQNHLDWEMTGPEGRPYDPGGVGNMCLVSGWGEFLMEKCRWLVDDIGVDGLETDGPYYGQPCHRTGHNHRTPGEAQYRNWKFEMDFYREMRAKGKIVHSPQGMFALLGGATSLPQGYREEDQEELAMLDLVTAFRTSLYTGQMSGLPGWAAWGFAALDPYHGHGVWPPEEHLVEYEHFLAGHFGYGLSAFIYGMYLHDGPRSEAILRRWIGFYKRYRETLNGDAVFLHPPTGISPDSILHVRPGAGVPAVMVAFNPTDRPYDLDWSIPLGRAGLAGETVATRSGEAAESATAWLDTAGNLGQRLHLAPYEVAWWEYRASVR